MCNYTKVRNDFEAFLKLHDIPLTVSDCDRIIAQIWLAVHDNAEEGV